MGDITYPVRRGRSGQRLSTRRRPISVRVVIIALWVGFLPFGAAPAFAGFSRVAEVVPLGIVKKMFVVLV
jgi:hypothetical protein